MGKATRWLKSLLGVGGGGGRRESKGSGGKDGPDGGDVGNKKRWSFAKPARTSNSVEVATGDGSRQWQRPYMSSSEKEQSRRAIAVAAATAAAADAAVAAAQAAAVVVRLTSQGRTAGAALAVADGREKSAAVKIQAAFRGYLARKALRALRALVKLQALVRGYLVRKQAAEDLQRMQSLFRAQSAVLSRKYQRATPTRDRTRVHPESRHHRRSLERVDETRSERAGSLHRRRLSSTLDPGVNSSDDSPKIVEVDPGRPKIRTRRLSINNNNNNPSSSCESSAAEDSSCCYKSSPLLCHIPPRLSTTPSLKNCNPEWSSLYAGDEYRHATTAHNTPRFLNSSSSWAAVQGHHHHVPVTPTKSVCGADGFRRYQAHQLLSNHPGYMASTESFSAKLRSLSAPRQRPDVVASKKKIAALYEIMESRASLSGIRMQRSCSQAQEIVGFRTAERMAEFGREVEVDHYLQRRW